MEILQPAKLVDNTEADDSDSLLLAQHCKSSSKTRKNEMEVGLFFPLTVLVVGEQSQEEEDGREKLCSANCSGNCFSVNRVDSKEKGGNLGNLETLQ